MREVTFLKRNADYWKAFETQLKTGETHNPDELAEKFVRLTDDLSYARTFYPKSTTTKYLNELTSVVHQKIYRNQKERSSRFVQFFKVEVPLASYTLRKPFLYAFLVFFVCMLLGFLSQLIDNSFASMVLGDGYVAQTMDNIHNGDPMGVYKDAPPLPMFLYIAFNNITVALLVFVKGIGLSFWAAYELFRNGVMVGVFMGFFMKYHLLYQVSLSIWIHGTLEISAIILSGGAAFALGNSLLFPKTYTRMQSLMMAARNGIKIMISLIPVFIIAAFLESFVTRHTEMPHILSLSIIFISLAFIVFYYVIYPKRIYDRIQKKYDRPEAEKEF